jgi:hypothetical protein
MNVIKNYVPVWAALAILFAAGFSVKANADEEALIKMSESIVADYREIRAQCAAEEDYDMKRVCFYKLRIKAWDYKQAREYLVQHKTPLKADELGKAYAVNESL